MFIRLPCQHPNKLWNPRHTRVRPRVASDAPRAITEGVGVATVTNTSQPLRRLRAKHLQCLLKPLRRKKHSPETSRKPSQLRENTEGWWCAITGAETASASTETWHQMSLKPVWVRVSCGENSCNPHLQQSACNRKSANSCHITQTTEWARRYSQRTPLAEPHYYNNYHYFKYQILIIHVLSWIHQIHPNSAHYRNNSLY